MIFVVEVLIILVGLLIEHMVEALTGIYLCFFIWSWRLFYQAKQGVKDLLKPTHLLDDVLRSPRLRTDLSSSDIVAPQKMAGGDGVDSPGSYGA